MALVSVVIPTFNRQYSLRRALDSVLAQTFKDWELIVVDDASTDQSRDVFARFLEESHAPARLVELKENSGVSAARNFGAENSTGSWLAFLDSDDEWLPDKLERQLELKTDFDLVHGEEIWVRNGVRVNQMRKHAKAGGQVFKRCVDICCISSSTTILKRELFKAMGGFDTQFPVCEDYDLWLKISSRMDVGFIEKPVIYKYGGHADQLSTSRPAMDFFRIKALIPFLDADHIKSDKKDYVAKSIIKRAEVLLRGYQKYQNLNDVPQVEAWLERARSARTQIQSAHSAADLRPRSVSANVL